MKKRWNQTVDCSINHYLYVVYDKDLEKDRVKVDGYLLNLEEVKNFI